MVSRIANRIRSQAETLEDFLARTQKTAFVFAGQASGESDLKGLKTDLFDTSRFSSGVRDIVAKVEQDFVDAFGREKLDELYRSENLVITTNAQPLAALEGLLKATVLEYLINEHLSGIEFTFKPEVVAGHSVGETVAMMYANALDAKNGYKLIQERMESMQKSRIDGQGMKAYRINNEGLMKDALRAANEEVYGSANAGFVIANYNMPIVFVVSGDLQYFDIVEQKVRERKGRLVQDVSDMYDFHHPIDQAYAARQVANLATKLSFQAPKVPIREYSNQTLVDTAEGARNVYIGKEKGNIVISSVNGPIFWNRPRNSVISKLAADDAVVHIVAMNDNLARMSRRQRDSLVHRAGAYTDGNKPLSDADAMQHTAYVLGSAIRDRINIEKEPLT